MKLTKRIVAVIVVLAMVMTCVFALTACADKCANGHDYDDKGVCKRCGELDPDYNPNPNPDPDPDPDPTPGPSHECNDKCPECGKCTTTCAESACNDKCPGHGSEECTEHTYGYVHVKDTWTHNYQCTKCGELAEEGEEGGDVEGLACTPELNVCADCGYTFTESEILDALFAITKNDEKLPGNYQLTGLVVSSTTYSTQYKNVTVDIFVGGKVVKCYNMYCDEGAVKLGATITVKGELMRYSNTYEFANKTCYLVGEATYEANKTVSVEIENGEVKGLPEGNQISGTELTFTIEPTEGYEVVSVTTEWQTLSANEQGEYTVTVIGDTTITVVISKTVEKETDSWNVATYATAKNWTSGTKYADPITFDKGIVTMTAAGSDSNTCKYYSSNGGSWRLYGSGNATLEIKVAEGYELYSITIKFSNSKFSDDDAITSEAKKLVSGSSITLHATGTLYIHSVTVEYVAKAAA